MKIALLLLATLVVFVSSDDSCENLPNKFLVKKLKYRHCEFIARKKTAQRCKFEGVRTHCPFTCDACGECIDSTTRFYVKDGGRVINRSCLWVGSKDTLNRCLLDGVYNKCPQTCNVPGSTAEDTIGKFAILVGKTKNLKVTCQWVEQKDTFNRCKLGNIAEICKKTCQMC